MVNMCGLTISVIFDSAKPITANARENKSMLRKNFERELLTADVLFL
jgi:hypothetical protein